LSATADGAWPRSGEAAGRTLLPPRLRLRKGLPEESISSDLCIAVEPNTDTCLPKYDQHEHREHRNPRQPRPPLKPVNVLPWANCYHSALECLLVHIPQLPEGTGRYVLPQTETMRHGTMNGKDFLSIAARQTNWLTKKRLNEPVPTTSSPEPPQVPRVTLGDVMGDVVMSIGPVSYKLDSVSEVTDPEEFMQQQRYLVQMKANIARRSRSGGSAE